MRISLIILDDLRLFFFFFSESFTLLGFSADATSLVRSGRRSHGAPTFFGRSLCTVPFSLTYALALLASTREAVHSFFDPVERFIRSTSFWPSFQAAFINQGVIEK